MEMRMGCAVFVMAVESTTVDNSAQNETLHQTGAVERRTLTFCQVF